MQSSARRLIIAKTPKLSVSAIEENHNKISCLSLLGLVVKGVVSLGNGRDLLRVLAGWKTWAVHQNLVGRHAPLIQLRLKGETFVFYYKCRVLTMLLCLIIASSQL